MFVSFIFITLSIVQHQASFKTIAEDAAGGYSCSAFQEISQQCVPCHHIGHLTLYVLNFSE